MNPLLIWLILRASRRKTPMPLCEPPGLELPSIVTRRPLAVSMTMPERPLPWSYLWSPPADLHFGHLSAVPRHGGANFFHLIDRAQRDVSLENGHAINGRILNGFN